GAPGLVALVPFGPLGRGALGAAAGVGEHVVVDLELLLRIEADDLLQAGDALGAELRAVHGVAAGQLGDGPADDGAQADEGRLVGDLLRLEDLGLERRDVLDVGRAVGAAVDPVHGAHVPAVGLVARGGVLGERDRGVALDGDLVVVPQDDEVAQLLGAGDRAGLAADALLEVAVG